MILWLSPNLVWKLDSVKLRFSELCGLTTSQSALHPLSTAVRHRSGIQPFVMSQRELDTANRSERPSNTRCFPSWCQYWVFVCSFVEGYEQQVKHTIVLGALWTIDWVTPTLNWNPERTWWENRSGIKDLSWFSLRLSPLLSILENSHLNLALTSIFLKLVYFNPVNLHCAVQRFNPIHSTAVPITLM